jgi:hypothetical protein
MFVYDDGFCLKDLDFCQLSAVLVSVCMHMLSFAESVAGV